MKNIKVSNRLKEFIDEHIDLIEDRNTSALYKRMRENLYRNMDVKTQNKEAKTFWNLLKQLDEPYNWLRQADYIPMYFCRGYHTFA